MCTLNFSRIHMNIHTYCRTFTDKNIQYIHEHSHLDIYTYRLFHTHTHKHQTSHVSRAQEPVCLYTDASFVSLMTLHLSRSWLVDHLMMPPRSLIMLVKSVRCVCVCVCPKMKSVWISSLLKWYLVHDLETIYCGLPDLVLSVTNANGERWKNTKIKWTSMPHKHDNTKRARI